jgi:hypothetical protein
MSLINIAASGNNLAKAGGCDGCADASAVSAQQVTNGQGYVEFVASEARTLRFVGLAFGGAGTAAGSIDFALRLQNGVVEVREAGGYKTENGFAAGDTFRIAVEGGVVKYLKNGSVFYTSTVQATYGLHVHVAMFDAGAAIANVTIGTGAAVASTTSAPGASVMTSARPQAQPRPAGSQPKRRGR